MKNILKKSISIFLILTVLIVSCSCSDGKHQDNRTKFSCNIWDYFDTMITVIAYCDNEEEFSKLETKTKDLFKHYNELYDIYNSYEGVNNIKTINDNAGTYPVSVDAEIIELLKFGIDLYEKTDGNVNIAFGSVLRIWHNARDAAETDPANAYVPDIEDLKEAAKHCNIADIIIDEAADTVLLSDSLMSLDVGAIAKGFATEKVAKALQDDGYDCFLISAGSSSIKAVGNKPDGSSWTTAVDTDPDYDLLNISGHSITTSGIYQRYYEIDGRKYHHIINKDTLMPEINYMSVTLITDDCGQGDGLATAVFNMDLETGMKFVESQENMYGMWVDLEGNKIYSNGYKDFIKAK